VVDDEDAINKMVCFLFEAEGFEVRRALDGQQAIEQFRQFRPHVLVMDVMMPKENGYRISRMIKSLLPGAAPKIVLMTARRLDHDRSREEAVMGFSKADAVVYKPFSPADLVATVRSLLSSS